MVRGKTQVASFRSVIALVAPAVLGAAFACGEDPVAALSHRIEQGAAQLPYDSVYGYLPALLEALGIPVESQVAVFSKTSIQLLRIQPSNARVLYFNDSVAVGWVPGGFIELAAQDPGAGIRFYTLQQKPDERLERRDVCLNCHKSATTLVRSVTSAPSGNPSGEFDVDSRTPFNKLWGGWFVTGGEVPAAHRGNAVFEKSERREITPALDPKLSLTPASDVVALMVFAHQMRMMNLLAHPDDVNEFVDYLLFVDEPPLPGPIRGSSGFAEKFSAAGPRDHMGRSLREFDLRQRLMRYPCSYMIYTEAFDALPKPAKEAVYRRMWQILSGEVTAARYERLALADREAVVEILRDTKKDLPDYFRRISR
jgi:hypothetical protein